MSRLVDVWPLYGLTLRTARLELRLPRDEELAGFADQAARGVHPPGEQPFLTTWTDGTAEDRARFVLREHWRGLSGWAPEKWQLGVGVFHDGAPLGVVALMGRDFAVTRQVTTWSWLGLEHHGKGYGTEARVALLTLAFDHLGAESARTDVFRDNHASQRVSRKLGYEPDGISVDARGTEALVSDRLRLSRSGWKSQDRPPVEIEGIGPCLPMFGR
jgi:RimJ/RimL family protein N-acetyltransferase